MKPILAIFVPVLMFITPFIPFSMADWINFNGAQNAPNIAEIYVEDDHVRLVLEIYIGDLDKFVDLLPDEFLKKSDINPPSIQERMNRFSDETFQFIVDNHKKLPAELKQVEPRRRKDRSNPFAGKINPYTRQPIPGPPKDKRVLYAELVYPFESKPEMLTIIPPLGKSGMSSVPIGFITFHKGAPVVDYRYLTVPAQLHLDWDDPWYSRFEKKSFKRWQQAGLKTFLYIEPYEVRHETLVRVKDMAAWMDLGLRGSEFIEVDEFEPLKKRISEFLLKHSRVRIDTKQLRPILDRSSFVKYTMTRTFFIDQPEQMLLNTAMLGVIITYLTKKMPQEVTVDWDLFSDRIQKVPTNAVDPAGPFPSYVTPEDNLFVWKNFLKKYQAPTVVEIAVDDSLIRVNIPVGSLLSVAILFPLLWVIRIRKKDAKPLGLYIVLIPILIVGGYVLLPYLKVPVARPSVMTPNITEKKAVSILNSLLKNIYRSFDFREEEDVYDRLATSVSGDLLSDIYLQNRKSLVVTQADGARARVKEVEILDVHVDRLDGPSLGLLFRARWTAMGSVGHWGHIHIRKNQYNANISVAPVDGA